MSCFVAFHYRLYGAFFLQQNRLHNIYRGFTHYKYYRANFLYIIYCYFQPLSEISPLLSQMSFPSSH